MNNKIIIAIDAMGGENAPSKNIEGVSIFLSKNKDKNIFFNLYGDKNLIRQELNKYKISHNRFEIFHSSSVVSDNETPLTAIKNSKDSSMWNAIRSQTEFNSNITLSAVKFLFEKVSLDIIYYTDIFFLTFIYNVRTIGKMERFE